jgi:hypothetical protein
MPFTAVAPSAQHIHLHPLAAPAGEDSERAPPFKHFVPGRDDRRYRTVDKSKPAPGAAAAAAPAPAAQAAAAAPGGQGRQQQGQQAGRPASTTAAGMALRALQGVLPGTAPPRGAAAESAKPAATAGSQRGQAQEQQQQGKGPGTGQAQQAAGKQEGPRAVQLGVAPVHLLAPSQSGAAQAKLMEQLAASESGGGTSAAAAAIAAACVPHA